MLRINPIFLCSLHLLFNACKFDEQTFSTIDSLVLKTEIASLFSNKESIYIGPNPFNKINCCLTLKHYLKWRMIFKQSLMNTFFCFGIFIKTQLLYFILLNIVSQPTCVPCDSHKTLLFSISIIFPHE